MNINLERLWFKDSSFDKLYPIKVFISTILTIALIIGLLMFIADDENKEGIFTFWTSTIFFFGIVYSLPTFVIYYLAYIYFTRQNFSVNRIRLYLIFATVVLMPFTFYFMGEEWAKINLFNLLGFSIAALMTYIIPLKRSMRQTQYGFIYFDEGGFTYQAQSEKNRIRWDDIQRIIAFKADSITFDEIRIEIKTENELTCISEEAKGWSEFVQALKSKFPTIPKNWDTAIVQPPFARNEIVLYELPS